MCGGVTSLKHHSPSECDFGKFRVFETVSYDDAEEWDEWIALGERIFRSVFVKMDGAEQHYTLLRRDPCEEKPEDLE